MITIPTGDLVGILSDVIPFASKEDDLPSVNCVRLEWDREQLHALATDRYRIGWATWDQDDEHEAGDQDDLFTAWGGADEPWKATIGLDDAKDLAAHYKLGPKERMVPLTVEFLGDRLRVYRSRDTGHSALTTVVPNNLVEFPDVRELMRANGLTDRVPGLWFNAKLLADFAKVRQRGPLEMTFTGVGKIVHVRLGSRFQGAIMSLRPESETPPPAEAEDAPMAGQGAIDDVLQF